MNLRVSDFRPVAIITVALLFGSLLGYVAFGMLEPKVPMPQYESLRYVSSSSNAAFPHTFPNRDAALTWLTTEIDFLERNGVGDQQPVVERMKSQLAYLAEHSEQKIQRSLLQYVREEVELCRASMAGVAPANPRVAPSNPALAPATPSGRVVLPERDP